MGQDRSQHHYFKCRTRRVEAGQSPVIQRAAWITDDLVPLGIDLSGLKARHTGDGQNPAGFYLHHNRAPLRLAKASLQSAVNPNRWKYYIIA